MSGTAKVYSCNQGSWTSNGSSGICKINIVYKALDGAGATTFSLTPQAAKYDCNNASPFYDVNPPNLKGCWFGSILAAFENETFPGTLSNDTMPATTSCHEYFLGGNSRGNNATGYIITAADNLNYSAADKRNGDINKCVANGGTVIYSCKSGYSGSVTFKCNSGNWAKQSGSCCNVGSVTITARAGTTVTIPSCVTKVTIRTYGGKGNGTNGGKGGYTYGIYTPGVRTLYAWIGYRGGSGCGGIEGGAGGDLAMVSISSAFTNTSAYRTSDLLAVAGGGGGVSGKEGYAGGYGGGGNSSGGYGTSKPNNCYEAAPGTLSTAGRNIYGNSGDGYFGGVATAAPKSTDICGGGGGGGYYGAAAGETIAGSSCYGGGGGGSGYCSTSKMSGCTGTNGANSSDAYIIIEWQ
jgi:hypothetical protein